MNFKKVVKKSLEITHDKTIEASFFTPEDVK